MKAEHHDSVDTFQELKQPAVVLYSFGFKHGVPVDVNMMWDVRFLPNPYWEEDLRPMNGCQPDVSDYVIKSRKGQEFLALLKPLITFLIDSNSGDKKKHIRFAVGCTGGRHRSVAVVEELGRYLTGNSVAVTIFHRDIERESA